MDRDQAEMRRLQERMELDEERRNDQEAYERDQLLPEGKRTISQEHRQATLDQDLLLRRIIDEDERGGVSDAQLDQQVADLQWMIQRWQSLPVYGPPRNPAPIRELFSGEEVEEMERQVAQMKQPIKDEPLIADDDDSDAAQLMWQVEQPSGQQLLPDDDGTADLFEEETEEEQQEASSELVLQMSEYQEQEEVMPLVNPGPVLSSPVARRTRASLQLQLRHSQ
jgi:hypothetical protein